MNAKITWGAGRGLVSGGGGWGGGKLYTSIPGPVFLGWSLGGSHPLCDSIYTFEKKLSLLKSFPKTVQQNPQ